MKFVKMTEENMQIFNPWGFGAARRVKTKVRAVITASINAQLYIDIVDTFLFPSSEKMFRNDEIIFQDDDASTHKAKTVKKFLEKRKSM